ncbi:uncharacterized protein LOC143651298 [Tamandua tetradactyla]|uniref:uncharacterized protein LOC143651298 n=1 Tax=Tamandua tetradactyla TaxID=48850 RepID=UPI0040539124
MRQERDKLKTELLGTKKPEIEVLENSGLPETETPENSAPCENLTRCGTSQPFRRKSGSDMELSRKDLWKLLMSDGHDPRLLHRKPTRVLWDLYKQSCCQSGLRGSEKGHIEGKITSETKTWRLRSEVKKPRARRADPPKPVERVSLPQRQRMGLPPHCSGRVMLPQALERVKHIPWGLGIAWLPPHGGVECMPQRWQRAREQPRCLQRVEPSKRWFPQNLPRLRLERGRSLCRPLERVGLPLSEALRINDSQSLKSNGLCHGGFQNLMGPVTPVFLPPYGNVYMYSMNVPPLLAANNLYECSKVQSKWREFCLRTAHACN